MNNIEKRLTMLEKVVGYEVDYSACSGNPEDCPSQSCDLTRCPLMNNLVHRFFRLAADRDEDYIILRHLVSVIMETYDIPPATVTLAKMRAEKESILRRSKHTHKMMGTVKGNESLYGTFTVLQQNNHTRLDTLDDKITVLEKKLNVKTS